MVKGPENKSSPKLRGDCWVRSLRSRIGEVEGPSGCLGSGDGSVKLNKNTLSYKSPDRRDSTLVSSFKVGEGSG